MDSHLTQLIKRCPSLLSESTIHGSLCALLAHSSELIDGKWQVYFRTLCHKISTHEFNSLVSYAEELTEQINSCDMSLKLPNEIEEGDLTNQIHYLAHWVDGYIDAYATSINIQKSQLNNKELDEWLVTLQTIQRQLNQLNVVPGDSNEEDNNGLLDMMEIYEFIRAGVFLTHAIWHANSNIKTYTKVN